jgi:hypothetical protein
VEKDYETEEEARAQQWAVESLMNELKYVTDMFEPYSIRTN